MTSFFIICIIFSRSTITLWSIVTILHDHGNCIDIAEGSVILYYSFLPAWSYEHVYWFHCCRTVLTFCFSWGLLFYPTLGNMTFCKNRMTFEIVSLPCLLLCYLSMQLHSHFVCVVQVSCNLPMPFCCLPEHSLGTDSSSNKGMQLFSTLLTKQYALWNAVQCVACLLLHCVYKIWVKSCCA